MSDLVFNGTHEYALVENDIFTGNSTILCAFDKKLQRDVCIKKVEIGTGKMREANLKQAKHEIQILAKFSNGQVPHIYDYFVDQNYLYIVMQWIQGDTLESMLKKHRVAENQLMTWMIQLCDVLYELSKRKIYHKDIKPANLMINEQKNLVLIDFNISLSLINFVEGTPGYKAPEMRPETKNTERDKVDMFAMGVIMYEFYKGSALKIGQEYSKISYRRGPKVWDKFIEPIETFPSMNKEMNDIIVRCMKYEPKQRFKDYRELKRYLQNAQRKGRQHGRKK